jgi:urea transport system permease protein
MRALRLHLLAAACLGAAPALALDAAAVRGLASEDSEDKLAAIHVLVEEADPAAGRVLQALSEERLRVAGGRVLLAEGEGDGEKLFDAATLAEVSPAPEGAETITVNNRIRRALEDATSVLRLLDPDRRVRLTAARELSKTEDPDLLALLGRRAAKEPDPEVRAILVATGAQAGLRSPDPAVRLSAAHALGGSSSRTVLALLQTQLAPGAEQDPGVLEQLHLSERLVNSRLVAADVAGRLFSGLSLASILLLAALGLAITYGVMGVINMAHGELLMIGAYSAYAVQRFFERYLPQAADWYVVAAIPVGFAAAFAVGIALERTVIRLLYGRPLETLLATWGLSLFLIQCARTVFGPQNVQVPNPSWMSSGIALAADIVLPWNRIAIIAFSLGVLAAVWLLLNRTRLGMFVRAVTQNRAMAGCVGAPTGRVDALAFGLGAGIAGLGGVALSQIANVGPEMGQGYIVDSFLVVVLGGVGQLAGAVWAALALGVASKFLEANWGAVIAKILVLSFVVVVIRKRPQGLFAPKGRTAEA